MAGLILEAPKKLKAREIVVAPRVPAPPKEYGSTPFTTVGDIVLDCDGETEGKPCGWHIMGPRAVAKLAYDEHRKLYHSDQIGVVLLNQPRQ